MADVNYKFRKYDQDTTLNATIVITPQARFRLWMAVKLINLAALVLGCRVNCKLVATAELDDDSASN